MDNQHRKIKGYKELTQEQIDLMNKIKIEGINIQKIINTLSSSDSIDKRWLAIGKTNLQQGLMAVTRSISKPDFF